MVFQTNKSWGRSHLPEAAFLRNAAFRAGRQHSNSASGRSTHPQRSAAGCGYIHGGSDAACQRNAVPVAERNALPLAQHNAVAQRNALSLAVAEHNSAQRNAAPVAEHNAAQRDSAPVAEHNAAQWNTAPVAEHNAVA
jgi:hypothetical protein